MQAYANKLNPHPEWEGRLKIAAWVLSAVVLVLVGMMRQYKIPIPEQLDLSFLPAVNAFINALTAMTLVASLYFIKQKEVVKHRNANYVALGLSVLFLLCYVAYHFTTPEAKFGDVNGDGLVDAAELAAVGGTRTAYLVLLFSHIILAGLILPFILFTFIRAYTGKYELHRKMARWVWPLWFYVAVTGPVVYLLLKPYY
jgi:putative membrane protein